MRGRVSGDGNYSRCVVMTRILRHQVLRNARALIERPTDWTRGVHARAENGRPVMWHDRQACRWCALGAINRAVYDLIGHKEQAEGIADEIIADCFPCNLSWINDKDGHATVLQLFDKALAD
jgi:hypothetical protein